LKSAIADIVTAGMVVLFAPFSALIVSSRHCGNHLCDGDASIRPQPDMDHADATFTMAAHALLAEL